MSEFMNSPVFTFLPFSPGNHHSKSLEGKVYVSRRDLVGIRPSEVRIGDFRSNLGFLGDSMNSDMTHNNDPCYEVYTYSDMCTFRYTQKHLNST